MHPFLHLILVWFQRKHLYFFLSQKELFDFRASNARSVVRFLHCCTSVWFFLSWNYKTYIKPPHRRLSHGTSDACIQKVQLISFDYCFCISSFRNLYFVAVFGVFIHVQFVYRIDDVSEVCHMSKPRTYCLRYVYLFLNFSHSQIVYVGEIKKQMFNRLISIELGAILLCFSKILKQVHVKARKVFAPN